VLKSILYLNYLDSISKYKKADTQSLLILKKFAMTNADAYRILNVSANSSPEEIKSAYRNMALKFHPDINPNANPDEMININLAYEKIKEAPLQNSPSNQSNYNNNNYRDNDFEIANRLKEQKEDLRKNLPKIKEFFINQLFNSEIFKKLWSSDELIIYNKKRRKHFKKKYENYEFPLHDNLYDFIYDLIKIIEKKYPFAAFYTTNFMNILETAKVYGKNPKDEISKYFDDYFSEF